MGLVGASGPAFAWPESFFWGGVSSGIPWCFWSVWLGCFGVGIWWRVGCSSCSHWVRILVGVWGCGVRRRRAHSRKRHRDFFLRQLPGLSGKIALPSSDSPGINARPCVATPSFPARADGHDTAAQATPVAVSSGGLLFLGLERLLAWPLIAARRMDPKISGTCANDIPGS